MSLLDFPSSPTNGQTYTAPNGDQYVYNSLYSVWESLDGVTNNNVLIVKSRVVAEAMTIPATVDIVVTLGYWEEGDGGGTSYIKSLVADFYGGWNSLDGQRWEISVTVINQRMFGAIGFDLGDDDPPDDTDAFNDAHSYIREYPNSWVNPILELLPGVFSVTSINATSITRGPWAVINKGSTILSSANNAVIYDFSDSRFGVVEKLYVGGVTANVSEPYMYPRVGIQAGKVSANGNGSNMSFHDCAVAGIFRKGSWYINAAEEFKMVGGYAVNNAFANNYVFIFDGANHQDLTSDYVTPMPKDTPQSFTNILVERVSGFGCTPIWIGPIGAYHRWENCYTFTNISNNIEIYSDTSMGSMQDIYLNIRNEGTAFGGGAPSEVLFSANTECFPIIHGFTYITDTVSALDQVIGSSIPGAGIVTLINADIRLATFSHHPTNGWFYPPEQFLVTGKLSTGDNTNYIHGMPYIFVGEIDCLIGTNIEFYYGSYQIKSALWGVGFSGELKNKGNESWYGDSSRLYANNDIQNQPIVSISNGAVYLYNTGISTPIASPNQSIIYIDRNNNMNVVNSSSNTKTFVFQTAEADFVPIVASSVGALSSYSANAHAKLYSNKMCYIDYFVNILNVGTGDGLILVALPFQATPRANAVFTMAGSDINTLKMIQGVISVGGIYLSIGNYDGTTSAATGASLCISGWYETI